MAPKWGAIWVSSLQSAMNLNMHGSPDDLPTLAGKYINHLIAIGALSTHHKFNLKAVEAAELKNDVSQDMHVEIGDIFHKSSSLSCGCQDMVLRLYKLYSRQSAQISSIALPNTGICANKRKLESNL